MSQTAVRVGAADNGRRLSLDEFASAEGQPGYDVELYQGAISVVDVRNMRHVAQFHAIRRQLGAYDRAHPNVIVGLRSRRECKIVLTLEEGESERHPDFAVYKRPPDDEENLWTTWIPEIVIEVVSPGSEQRDYVEKRQEYLLFGVREYWIVDADRREVLVLRRHGGRWIERVLRPPEVYTTKLLPEFEFHCAAVFAAADAAGG